MGDIGTSLIQIFEFAIKVRSSQANLKIDWLKAIFNFFAINHSKFQLLFVSLSFLMCSSWQTHDMKCCSDFRKGRIYFLIELDSALSLIPVITMISCDMCLSLLYLLICDQGLKPIFHFPFFCSPLSDGPFDFWSLQSFVWSSVWFLKFAVRCLIVCLINFEVLDKTMEIPNSVFCISILQGPVQLFKIYHWEKSKSVKLSGIFMILMLNFNIKHFWTSLKSQSGIIFYGSYGPLYCKLALDSFC